MNREATGVESPLKRLHDLGQSYWMDSLTRGKIQTGELGRRVEHEGLRGITSNPTIFHKAISAGDGYDGQIRELLERDCSEEEIYEEITTADVRNACDVLRPVYDSTGGTDGFVSLEVSPHLADDTTGSIAEAQRLWRKVNRPNLLVKIPGTQAGISAVEQCLSEGININITLLFSVERYKAVAEAYLRALERRIEAGQRIETVASVASFFLSRIDTNVDRRLEELITRMVEDERDVGVPPFPQDLLGQVAIANAKLAYQHFLDILENDRWKRLSAAGAKPQRLLWASTSTKNPRYADIKYVDPLIGPYTVNTMPDDTIEAFADHGHPAETVGEQIGEAKRVMEDLQRLEIDFREIADELEREGIRKFVEPYDATLALLREWRRST